MHMRDGNSSQQFCKVPRASKRRPFLPPALLSLTLSLAAVDSHPNPQGLTLTLTLTLSSIPGSRLKNCSNPNPDPNPNPNEESWCQVSEWEDIELVCVTHHTPLRIEHEVKLSYPLRTHASPSPSFPHPPHCLGYIDIVLPDSTTTTHHRYSIA